MSDRVCMWLYTDCMSNDLINRTEWVIIPCGGAKRDEVCQAADLYIGSLFAQVLASARGLVDDTNILILSAKHGLITLDTMVAPYDLKMGKPGLVDAVTVAKQAFDLGIGVDDEVMTLLPATYERVLNQAMAVVGPIPYDIFDGNIGIGDMKAIAKKVRTAA